MNELEQLLSRLNLPNDPRLSGLAQLLKSEQGHAIAQGISAQTASQIAQAIDCAQRGDQAAARQTVQEILRTPEGALLAARLKSLMKP